VVAAAEEASGRGQLRFRPPVIQLRSVPAALRLGWVSAETTGQTLPLLGLLLPAEAVVDTAQLLLDKTAAAEVVEAGTLKRAVQVAVAPQAKAIAEGREPYSLAVEGEVLLPQDQLAPIAMAAQADKVWLLSLPALQWYLAAEVAARALQRVGLAEKTPETAVLPLVPLAQQIAAAAAVPTGRAA
jgi:hypothetical protein